MKHVKNTENSPVGYCIDIGNDVESVITAYVERNGIDYAWLANKLSMDDETFYYTYFINHEELTLLDICRVYYAMGMEPIICNKRGG